MSEEKYKRNIPIIGIDFGTRNSAVSVYLHDKVEMIPNPAGENSFGGKSHPSEIFVHTDGKTIDIGHVAREMSISNPGGYVINLKRRFGDEDQTVTLYEGTKYEFHKKVEELAAYILSKIRADAETYLGQKIDSAVITVPAYFNDLQRRAVRRIASFAGFRVSDNQSENRVWLLNEPTAAALSYGFEKFTEGESTKVLVYDLGGGTLDLTVMEIMGEFFEVLATEGDTKFGGTDFDSCIYNLLSKEIKQETNFDVESDTLVKTRLLQAVEEAKIKLSSSMSQNINIPYLFKTFGQDYHYKRVITRAEYENMITPIVVNKTDNLLNNILKSANLKRTDIDKILLVGGPTKTPLIQETIYKYFNKRPSFSIDPMECVSRGAAIYAASKKGDIGELVFMDVIPLTLGIDTAGGIMAKLIERNSKIPISKEQIFSTVADNQTSVDVEVYQGERAFSKDNTFLGRFTLQGIVPKPRGIPQIKVTFTVDSDGVYTVQAQDVTEGGSNVKQDLRISQDIKYSKEEIDKRISEAEEFIERDKLNVRFVTEKSHLDNMTYLYNSERVKYEELNPQLYVEAEGLIDRLNKFEFQGTEDSLQEFNNLNTQFHNVYNTLRKQLQESNPPQEGDDEGSPQEE